MDYQETHYESHVGDRKIIAYKFDGCTIFPNKDKYCLVTNEGQQHNLGPIPGTILWILVETAYRNPGQLVKKETLLDLVHSKGALKTNIWRLKQGIIRDKIITERNQGYRIQASKVEAIYEGEAERMSPDKPLANTAAPANPYESEPVEMKKPPVSRQSIPSVHRLLTGTILSLLVGVVYLGYDDFIKTKKITQLDKILWRERSKNAGLKETNQALQSRTNIPSQQKVLTPLYYILGPPRREPVRHLIELEKEYNALILTIAAELPQEKFWMEMADTSKKPIIEQQVKKDKFGNLSIVIPREGLKDETYRLRVYPVGNKSLATEYGFRLTLR